ncbi:MAG: hypothetical protein MUC69_03725 [Gemmatimonadales bacterium]|nr:hypothetical protein [Gemmatimonadales bacterium]
MPRGRRGHLLAELLLALVLLALAAGPATRAVLGAERGVAAARARDAVARAATHLLAELEPAPCGATPAAPAAPVALRWWREPGVAGRVVAVLAVPGRGVADSFVLPAVCP